MAEFCVTDSNTQRRRQLFPSSDEDSDDLGHISPLCDAATSCSSLDSSFSETEYTIPSFNSSSISDYVILENLNMDSKIGDEERTTNLQPSYAVPSNDTNKSGNDDTPSRKSNFTLKTPQDASSANSDVPKLVRKSPFKSSSVELGKRKLPFSSPIYEKHIKLDISPKARTVLFPRSMDNVTVSTKSFYTKSIDTSFNSSFQRATINVKKNQHKTTSLYLSGRKSGKRRFGQINAGVRHRIRKPKQKQKLSKPQLTKAALNVIKHSHMNEFVDENVYFVSEQPLSINTSVKKNTKSVISEEQMERDLDAITVANKKRAASPPPDLNKKFFKFKRSSATVTVQEHMKLKFDDGKMSLVEEDKRIKTKKRRMQQINFDVTDLMVPENDGQISESIDNILFSLNDDKENVNEKTSSEQLVLHAYNSVTMSENAIHLHSPISKSTINNSIQTNVNNVLLSPTSLMCNMTSGLALNSPEKRRCNFQSLNEISSTSIVDMTQDKLFPIFYERNKNNDFLKQPKVSHPSKKFKPLPKGQMLLDAGQKKFGITECGDCKFVYHMGDPNDELLHQNYHDAGNVLRFSSWKEERVVSQFGNARIIRVLPTDPKPWLKKVRDLLEVVNRDLGDYDMSIILDNTQVYLYITNKTIAGCLVAESKTTAYSLLSQDSGIDLCSEESYPIKCGVARIWVFKDYRQQGVGTALLNSLRGNFMFGSILSKNDIAFSSPTELGKAFASKYFNTPNFLIYTS